MAFDAAAYSRAHYLKNAEKYKERARASSRQRALNPRTEDRVCSRCNVFKANSEFDKNASACKECRRQRANDRYSVNPEPIKSWQKDYRESNKSKISDGIKQRRRQAPERWLVYHARSRAKKLGLPCTITPSDINIPERCPYLDIPLYPGDGRFTDNSPSLDRIIPERGYVPDNVIVVSHRANSIKRDASLEELRMIVVGIDRALSTKTAPDR